MANTSTIDCSVEPQERISDFEARFIIIIAIIVDIVGLAGLIPFLGLPIALIINFLMFTTLWIWFRLHKVSAFEKFERIVIKLSPLVIENIPFVNIIPSWTVSTIILIWLVRRDDAKYKEAFELECGSSDSENQPYTYPRAANNSRRYGQYKEAA